MHTKATPSCVIHAPNHPEIKAEKDIDDTEVQEKAEAGKKYCEAATVFNLANRGKKWVYVLIPHTAVVANMSLRVLTILKI